MASPMTRVSSLVSRDIGNYLTNKKTWDFIINVKNFGAKGDGITNDTVAIQKAINEAISEGLTEVWFPHGTYIVDYPLDHANEVTFIGDDVTMEPYVVRGIGQFFKRDTTNNPLIGKLKTVTEDERYNSWPVLVHTITGRFICFYSSGIAHKGPNESDLPGRQLCYKYSDNDGLTWSEEIVMFYDTEIDYTTFGAVALSNGDVVCFVNVNTVTSSQDYYVMKSTDDGMSFNLVFKFSESTNDVVRSGSYPNVPVEMDNGQVIASKQVRLNNGKLGLGFIFSSDNGNTWNDGVMAVDAIYDSFSELPWEVRTAYIGNGRLIAMGRNDTGNIYQLNSSDYGQTWTVFTTNIDDTRSNPVFPLFFDDGTITLYYNDRNSNGIKKRTVPADFIFMNPTLWNEPTVLDYTSGERTKWDSGYMTSCRIRSIKQETLTALYTTRDVATELLSTPKKSAIVVFYDTVEAPKTKISNDNIFINGGFNVWQYGTDFDISDTNDHYTASQWIFTGSGTNNVSRGSSSVFNMRTLLIDADNSSGPYRLFQPLIGLSNGVVTLTCEAFSTDQITIKPYVRYTSGSSVETDMSATPKVIPANDREIISFTFRLPQKDIGTPVYLGFEMNGQSGVTFYNAKLETGYTFTGFAETDQSLELQKCLMFYEEFTNVLSMVARNDGSLMYVLPFSQKRAVPSAVVYWNNQVNTARAWQGADVGTISVTVESRSNFLRIYGTKPGSTTPTYYDIDRVVIDARV